MNSNEYESAILAHNKAFHIFDAIREKYRAMEIDDDVFLPAKDEYEKATLIFDAAFSKEQGSSNE